MQRHLKAAYTFEHDAAAASYTGELYRGGA